MTTDQAAKFYAAEHLVQWGEKPLVVYNPRHRPVEELPVIFGFNNGGNPGWFRGVLMAEDGVYLGGHVCSHESYMPHDLGCIVGAREDRHEEQFQRHYPDGYQMEFVPEAEVKGHEKLMAAYQRNQEKGREHG